MMFIKNIWKIFLFPAKYPLPECGICKERIHFICMIAKTPAGLSVFIDATDAAMRNAYNLVTYIFDTHIYPVRPSFPLKAKTYFRILSAGIPFAIK